MTSRERVTAALRREPADRVPVFMWYHPDTARRLAALLDIPVSRLPDALADDVRMTWVNNNYAMEGVVHDRDGGSHVDEWGIEWTRLEGFNQITRFPLAAATREQVLDYAFPERLCGDLLDRMAPVIARGEDRFIGCDVSPCAFEMFWRLRGMEETMLDLAGDAGLARQMIGRCLAFAQRLSEGALGRCELGWLWTGDDVGGQSGLMLSPAMWRDMVRPGLQRLFDLAHRHRVYAAFHCCGAIRPIIGDLVEMGLDVLNPVQPNCPGMDPLDLKREFGQHLTFMGGVDTQDLLPNGTAEQVYTETRRLIEGMTSDGGGFILAASHAVPPETPDENIFAMYRAAGIDREAISAAAADIRGVD